MSAAAIQVMPLDNRVVQGHGLAADRYLPRLRLSARCLPFDAIPAAAVVDVLGLTAYRQLDGDLPNRPAPWRRADRIVREWNRPGR